MALVIAGNYIHNVTNNDRWLMTLVNRWSMLITVHFALGLVR
jgi:hypothetical protein